MELSDKLFQLTKKKIEMFHTLGLYTVEQVLSYYPVRYDYFNTGHFNTWKIKEKVLFSAQVISQVKSFRFARNHVVSNFEVMIEDFVIKVSIFNRPWAKQLQLNQKIIISGIYMGKNKVTATSYQGIKNNTIKDNIIPIYSMKTGMQQRFLRESILKVLNVVVNNMEDIIPQEFIEKYHLLHRKEYLMKVHCPHNLDDVKKAYRTLKYEEFLHFFVAIQLLKEEHEISVTKEIKSFDQKKLDTFISHLSFSMTKDQENVLMDILNDMRSEHIMYRLLQGDVSSGKTIVAMLALYACVLAGYQGTLLVPTEILARQHESTFQKLFCDTNVCVRALYSSVDNKTTQRILSETENGKIDILIGTHSILQERVKFLNLGLVIADEQQRFGVEQRKQLKEKGEKVDFLLMSATPIPRTLASSIYGDMEISTIETMPPGRKTVLTKLIHENSFRSVLGEVRKLLQQGHQLYVICAAVEESEMIHARNVLQVYDSLLKLFMPEYKVGILHGRMRGEEKEKIMQLFQKNDFQILVSTTVVEVGVNVVNATGMIVYDADRFGIAQLHQLRGRIQRGSHQGKCWLLTDSKDEKVEQRLQVLVNCTDGFKISFEDLRLRGPGDILGTRQSGLSNLVIGNFIEDTAIIQMARNDAKKMMIDIENPDYKPMIRWVKENNEKNTTYRD